MRVKAPSQLHLGGVNVASRTTEHIQLEQAILSMLTASTLLAGSFIGASPVAAAVPATSAAGDNVGFLKGGCEQLRDAVLAFHLDDL